MKYPPEHFAKLGRTWYNIGYYFIYYYSNADVGYNDTNIAHWIIDNEIELEVVQLRHKPVIIEITLNV